MLPPPKPPELSERTFVLPDGCDEVLQLLGTTGLAEFLAFARDSTSLMASPGSSNVPTPMELAEAWRDAAEVYEALNDSEAYPTESPVIFPLPEGMKAHAQAFLGQPHIQRQFDLVPIALGMVPLAQLIAMQPQLNLGTTSGVATGSGSISDASLAEICLPFDSPPHTLEVIQRHSDGITFAADNHDIRFLKAYSASGAALDVPSNGHVQQVLALPVGFSSNVLNVVRFQNRLVLNNGYHRAYALWRRGFTQVPAVIQVCRHWDDIGLVGSSEMYDNSSVYFDRERPPLLKDFADRRLCMSFARPRSRKYVRIRYQIETGYLRDTFQALGHPRIPET